MIWQYCHGSERGAAGPCPADHRSTPLRLLTAQAAKPQWPAAATAAALIPYYKLLWHQWHIEHNNTTPCTAICGRTYTHLHTPSLPQAKAWYTLHYYTRISTKHYFSTIGSPSEMEESSSAKQWLSMGMSDGTTVPIFASKTPINTSMDIVYQWFIMWLLSVIMDMASYIPSSSGDDLGNTQLHIMVVSHALLWSWMVWFIMTTQAVTAPYIAWTTWLLAVAAPNYLHLHEMETSPINYNYWKHFKFGHFIRTPPGKWNIKYRCFAPSTDCTNFASEECYACVSCCYVSNPTPAAMTTPEAMYKTVSREILPRHDTTTSAVLWPGHYI